MTNAQIGFILYLIATLVNVIGLLAHVRSRGLYDVTWSAISFFIVIQIIFTSTYLIAISVF